jgi:hypothetical protein
VAPGLGYSDSNVPCNNRRVARWVYGEIVNGTTGSRLYGWYPARAVDDTVSARTAGCG